MKVCHVSPTYFGPDSVIGGGERYAEELARNMAKQVRVKFLSFGSRFSRERYSPSYERVILRNVTGRIMSPFSLDLWREVKDADVIHCHQYFTLPSFLSCVIGKVRGIRVFISDLGGGGWTPGYHVDQSRWMTAHLPISEYAARVLPGKNQKQRVIYGGVDLNRYPPRIESRHNGTILFLGRILSHKGIHFLIRGLPDGFTLNIIGREGDASYSESLRLLARGKDVRFHREFGDSEVLEHLRSAMVLVHPTPADDSGSGGASELLGLALIEAMACGCPVIASKVCSLPEIVQHGKTGFLVTPNEPSEISAAILKLCNEPNTWIAQSRQGRARVEQHFTWEKTVARCLQAYDEFGSSTGLRRPAK